MKEFRLRIILILGAIALSVYLLYPTYVEYQNIKEIKQTLENKKTEVMDKDSNLTNTQVDQILRMTEDSILTADPDITKNREKRVKLGLDLQGGMRVVLEVNTGSLLLKLANNPDDIFKSALEESQKEAD